MRGDVVGAMVGVEGDFVMLYGGGMQELKGEGVKDTKEGIVSITFS